MGVIYWTAEDVETGGGGGTGGGIGGPPITEAAVAAPRGPVDRPHFSFPFQLQDSGSIGVVEQDTENHVMACANVIVRCPQGFRDDNPEFGWQFPVFASYPPDLGQLEASLRRWEPRCRPRATLTGTDPATSMIQIDVEVDNG